MEGDDVVEVTNFFFHALRKFRVHDALVGNTYKANARNRLAVSSKFSLVFVVSPSNELLCISTNDLLKYAVNKENMNVEVVDLPIKKLQLGDVEVVNDMGVNSEGTHLGILLASKAGTFVEIFDIAALAAQADQKATPFCKVRVGSDAGTQGCAFEWNPAFGDIFAATGTDSSILVAKVNFSASSSVSIVGSKKMGAQGLAISWSPKGKQLVIGDSTGKVIQLKPELEVVRSTMPPDSIKSPCVSGLCWLATTDWLVAYAEGNEQNTFVMNIKKDKGPEWRKMQDLSFSNLASTQRPLILSSTELLVDWNVALVASTRFSEVMALGKLAELWQTWQTDETKSVHLPTTSSSNETFPIGIGVDRSAQAEILLNADGSARARPAPIVVTLTNDGVLVAHHVVSTMAAHKPCQVAPQPIELRGFSASTAPAVTAVGTPSVPGVAATTSSPATFPFASPPPTAQQAANPGVAVLKDHPLKSEMAAKSANSSNFSGFLPGKPLGGGQQAASSPFFGASTPAPTAVAGPDSGAAATPSTPSKPAESSPAVDAAKLEEKKREEERKMKEKLVAEQQEALRQQEHLMQLKFTLVRRLDKLNRVMKESSQSIGEFGVGLQETAAITAECVEVVESTEAEAKEVIKEMQLLLSGVGDGVVLAKKYVEEMEVETRLKATLVAELSDLEKVAATLRQHEDADKQIRFTKLESSIDALSERYANAIISLAEVKQWHRTTSMRMSPAAKARVEMSSAEEETILKTMRTVSKVVMGIREQLQRSERDFAILRNSMTRSDATKETTDGKEVRQIQLPVYPKLIGGFAQSNEVTALRQKMIAKMTTMGNAPVRTRKIQSTAIEKSSAAVASSAKKALDTSSLTSALLNMSMSPRRSAIRAAGNKKDAATQADAPPEVKIEKVIVTVASPAPAAISSTKTSTSTPTATTTSTPSSAASNTTMLNFKPATTSTPVGGSANTPSSFLFGGDKKAEPTQPGSIFGQKSATAPITTTTVPKQTVVGAAKVNENGEATSSTAPPEIEQEKVQGKKSKSPSPTPIVEEPDDEPQKPVPAAESSNLEEKAEQGPNVEEVKNSSATLPSDVASTTNVFGSPATTTSSTSVFGNVFSTPKSTSPKSLFGTPAAASPATTTSIFGGGVKAAATASPIFGGGLTANAQNPATQPSGGGFGMFGKPAIDSNATSASPVTFSFKSNPEPTPAASSTTSIFGGGVAAKPASSIFGGATTASNAAPSIFGGSSTGSNTGFAAAAAAAAATEEGMDDDGSASGSAGVFGGKGFLSGFGSNATSANANTNVFGKPRADATQNANQNSWMFGGGASQQQQPQKSAFSSFGQAAAAAAASTSPSATSSAFGGSSQFGGAPVFGKPAFGGGATNSSTTGSGFAQFAVAGEQKSSVFGGGSGQPTAAAPSIFGGGVAQTGSTPSIFGGGTQSQQKPAFTSWR